MGARLVLRALDEWPAPVAQDDARATLAPKLGRADGVIDWAGDGAALDRLVRALDPWPGTRTTLGGEVIKVLAAEPADGHGAPGTVLAPDLTVACGTGALRLTRVQAAGRAATDGAAFLRGRRLGPGVVLGG
jgi:methionyl-tRNA formyltransferase